MDIGLTGHHRHGADLSIEIEYQRTPDIPASGPTYASGGEPSCGGDVEITDIRPFRMVKQDDQRLCKIKEYLTPVPDWLAKLIIDCIDTGLLTGGE
jgi:hypothetical protein